MADDPEEPTEREPDRVTVAGGWVLVERGAGSRADNLAVPVSGIAGIEWAPSSFTLWITHGNVPGWIIHTAEGEAREVVARIVAAKDRAAGEAIRVPDPDERLQRRGGAASIGV